MYKQHAGFITEPLTRLDFITPFEKFYGTTPDLKQIKIVGSSTQVLNENLPAGKKFELRSSTCYLVGFTKTGYLLFDPKSKKVINSCNVVINENKLYRYDFSPSEDTLKFSEENIQVSENSTTPVSPTPSNTNEQFEEEKSNTEVVNIDYDWDSTENLAGNSLKL